jgi:hypothetical protein
MRYQTAPLPVISHDVAPPANPRKIQGYGGAEVSVRVWLDDLRDPRLPHIQAGYGSRGDEVWVKTVPEALALLRTGAVCWISLDNDLGEGEAEGYEVACFIEQAAWSGALEPLEVHAHSDNCVAGPRMRAAIDNARRYWAAGSPGRDQA